MLQERIPDLSKFVEPDRVRKEVYTDPAIFELEMERIHETVWIYCGHESQVPKAGDYYAVQIGRQPMLMVRGADGSISVLYNRCPHRGNMMCGDRHGNTGEFFRCSYHAWTFKHDGSLRSIPMMESGYAGTRLTKDSPELCMKRAARVENYRGFVFASLAGDGPSLKEFLGKAIVAFDDMCDRAPEGEVEVVPNCFRVIQHSNWKIFLENQLDALHPSVVHQSTGRAAHEIEKKIEKQTRRAPLSYHMLSAFATVTIDKWDNFQTLNYPYGHCVLTGYMGLRPKDPDTLAYEAVIFDNVSGTQIGEQTMAVIEQAVKEFGMGFMMVGGDQSFGLGGYFKTPIERLLPVSMEVTGKHELPSLGLVIVMDRSGSMAGQKMELAKEAAARSVELLREDDVVGVIAFDDKPWEIVHWRNDPGMPSA